MHYPLATIAVLTVLMALGSPARLETHDSSELDPTRQIARQIKWPRKTIEVAFSTALLSPGAQIKSGSDVVGAARRALARWSSMANVNFVVTWSSATSVSPSSGGDGISLITVADTPENASFNADSTTGRTRVFYDPETGAIAEADISINPQPRSEEGAELQFSTDGSPGTYDLEATFTHEVGHLLGLDHSTVLASTMQSRQAFNGTFGLPALTERTLTEDDRQRVRSLYGPKQHLGRIEGRMLGNQSPGTLEPLQAVTVWAESIATGRVIASDVTSEDGSYQLAGLTPGQYRVLAAPPAEEIIVPEASVAVGLQKRFSSFELSGRVTVTSDAATVLNYNLVPPQTSKPLLSPRWIGLNGELSTVALPLEAGKRTRVYLGGEGVDQVPGTSISVNSRYFAVDPSSLTREQLATPFPVISFELSVAANAPFGDYSVRLQSNSGELAYIPGAITIDPGVGFPVANPVDDARFFVAQHYVDLLGHEPDRSSVEKFMAQVAQCSGRADCLRARRLDLSTALFVENGLPESGAFLQGLYAAGLGRRPRFAEFENDRSAMATGVDKPDSNQLAMALAFVQRSEFERKYAPSLTAREFVDSLILSVAQITGIDLSSERNTLTSLYDGTNPGRAAILTRVVTHPDFVASQYNQAFVLTQYFTYLRRDPDESGFNFWVNVLKSKPARNSGAARSMVCAFLNSTEYQLRFGMVATHSSNECGN